MFLLLDAIASLSTYPGRWVGGSVMFSDIGDSYRIYRIYRACELFFSLNKWHLHLDFDQDHQRPSWLLQRALCELSAHLDLNQREESKNPGTDIVQLCETQS